MSDTIHVSNKTEYRLSEEEWLKANLLRNDNWFKRLKKFLGIVLVFYICFSSCLVFLCIGDAITHGGDVQNYVTHYEYMNPIPYLCALVFTSLLLTGSRLRIRQEYRSSKKARSSRFVSFDDNGICVEGENYRTLWKWDEIYKWMENRDYLVIWPSANSMSPIPKRIKDEGFPLESLTEMLTQKVGKPGMARSLNPEATGENQTLGTIPFVFAGMSFIPLIGVLFGLIAIVGGLSTKRSGGKKLALIGAAGIGFTILVYGTLFYFGEIQHGGIYDDLRTKMAQSELNSLVQNVEFYKIQHGEYPDSLEALRKSLPKNSFAILNVYDPRNLKSSQHFYYKKVGSDHYYLRGVAPDGQPFSPGALIPQVTTTSAKLGLLTAPPSNPSNSNP